MTTPSDFQRLASVVRATFPAPIAAPFYRSTEEKEEALPGLLSALIRYLALLQLRAYWSGAGESQAVEDRLAVISQPSPDGRWLDLLRKLVLALEPSLQPDPVLVDLLLREKGMEHLEDAVSLRNRLVHDCNAEAKPALRRMLYRALGLLLPLRFHRILVPIEVTSTAPLNTYRAVVYQGYARPFPATRLRTEAALGLGEVYLARTESPRLLHLGPLLLPEGERLFLLSHRAGKALVYWDPATGETAERAEPRMELDSLQKRLQKGTGFIESRHLHLEGESLVARRLDAGSEVAGRYQVQSYLRSGGMADVYQARDLETGEPVALKMLPLELTRETATLARFLREIDEIRKVDHPRVVRYLDHGEDAGDRHLVLECAPGWKGRGPNGAPALDIGDLKKPIAEEELWAIACDVAEGLQAIHSRGLIHRDLKPGNVLLFEDEEGRRAAKISDFGISTRAGATQYTLTGFFVGTPEYMAPEQADPGVEIGPESDLYALGVILYECQTGDVPFRGPTPFATLEQHRTRRPEWPLRKNPKASPGLVNVVMKCLQKEPKRRYRSAIELLKDLNHHREDPAGFQEISTLRAGEDLGDLVIEEEIEGDREGTVFRASQPSTGKRLRVRAFPSAIADDSEKRERVLARVKRLAEAHHPVLPIIVGTGEARGTPFVVLEPVLGSAPQDLQPKEAVRAALGLARGLAALHAREIPHGRVECDTVRVDAEAAAFADFGWLGANSLEDDVRALGAVIERLQGNVHDPGSDLAAIVRHARRPAGGYSSVRALIEDLECLLGSRPLTHARPATLGYVLKLFMARHLWGFAGSVAVLVLVFIAGLVAWTWWPEPRYTLTEVRPFTSDSGLTTEPSLSRDGKLLAYASDRAGKGNLDIWIQPVEGGEPRQLTFHDADDREPDLSRDGKLIAFRSERDGGGVYLVSAAGETERKLVDSGRTPRISPDARRVAYWVGTVGGVHSGARAYVISAEGGPPSVVCPDFRWALEPVWSPNGKRLLFFGSGVPDPGSPGREPIVDWWVAALEDGFRVPTGIAAMFPGRQSLVWDQRRTGVWAPEENRFFFSSSGGRANRSVFMVPLPSRTSRASAPPQNLSGATASATDPTVAEAGQIAFSMTTSRIEIWSLPLDPDRGDVSGPPRKLTENPGWNTRPSISREGSRLTFNTGRSGTEEVWTMDLATGRESPLVPGKSEGRQSQISPDGTRVAYATSDFSAIRIVPYGSGKVVREFEACDVPYRWTRDGRAILHRRDFGISLLDTETGARRPILQHPDYQLWRSHLSWDDRWVAFNAVRDGRSRIFVARFQPEKLIPPDVWIAITDETNWDDKPTWSPNGNILYFVSERDAGFRCIWAQRLEPLTKQPSGEGFVVQHFHSARLSLRNVSWGSLEMDIARDKLVFCLGEVTGNVLLAHIGEER
jgi:Tol biopolymer transport system component